VHKRMLCEHSHAKHLGNQHTLNENDI